MDDSTDFGAFMGLVIIIQAQPLFTNANYNIKSDVK